MNDPLGPSIGIQIILVFACMFFSLAAAGVEGASESRLKKAAEEGNKKAARMLPMVQEPDNFLFSMGAAAVLSGLFAAWFAASRFSPLLTLLSPRWAEAAVVLLAALVLISLCLYVPRRLAAQKPLFALGFFPAANGVYQLLRPLNAVFRLISSGILRLLGVRPGAPVEDVSEDEILMMVDAGEESGTIESAEKELIENVFEFNNMTAEDIMIHRTNMVVIWTDDTREEILRTIQESGLSRFPVCGEDVDDIVGILSTRDYLMNAQIDPPKPLDALLRKAYFVPESVHTDLLFREMQHQKVHMSIVVDEYGGTSGLLTMEDLLEQLVGDIYDEFDAEEEQEISPVGDNQWRISGSAPLESVYEALELPLDEDADEYDTLGGLIFSKLSVIPQDGSRPEVDVPGMHIQVEEIAEHRVAWVLVTRTPLPDASGEDDE